MNFLNGIYISNLFKGGRDNSRHLSLLLSHPPTHHDSSNCWRAGAGGAVTAGSAVGVTSGSWVCHRYGPGQLLWCGASLQWGSGMLWWLEGANRQGLYVCGSRGSTRACCLCCGGWWVTSRARSAVGWSAVQWMDGVAAPVLFGVGVRRDSDDRGA